jgi:nitrate/TMAO reductase-like tetraheme cytochrome c subunit
MRKCSQCLVEKDDNAFYQNGKRMHGQCKDCHCLNCRNRRQRLITTIRQYDQERSWRRRGILNEKGLPFERMDYDRWYQIQQGCCRICKKHNTEFTRNLAVDHNHETGIVRGLLCINCNKGLGHFQDDKQLLREAIKYLNQ